MPTAHSDALVVYGATGDLAHKMIFPGLYAMVKRGALNVPVIGVAFPKWSLERLHRRVTHSIKQSGGIDNKRALHQLLSLLRYVSGDYNDGNTFTAIKEALGERWTARFERGAMRGCGEHRGGGLKELAAGGHNKQLSAYDISVATEETARY